MIIEGESLYDFYKRNKICVHCGQKDAAKGKTRCLNCLSVAAERQRAKLNRETEEQKEERLLKYKEYSRKRREEFKEKGLCISCGNPLYKNSTVYCYKHVLANRKNNRKRKKPIERKYRKTHCSNGGENTVKNIGLHDKGYGEVVIPEYLRGKTYAKQRSLSRVH